MDLYTLDALYRRDRFVERFKSLIWTERWMPWGDFELVIFSDVESRNLLKPGTRLSLSASNYVMVVETVEDKTDEQNERFLTVKGRSLELILDDRVAKESLNDLTTSPKWTISDQPADIMRKVFHDICVTGILDTQDIIPYVSETTFMAASTIPEPVDTISVEIEPATVYTVLQNLGDIWQLGFRLLRENDTTGLYFDVYAGSDRTSTQNTLPAVIFSTELDNLQNITRLQSISSVKNVAYVFSPAGFEMVYGIGVDPEVEGFERHVLVVNATDITDENPDVTAALLQRGADELSKYRAYSGLDGEISQDSKYEYGVDYNLGDLVEMRDESGDLNVMRVTEQIFSSDGEGEKSYPTLSINVFVNTGSWLSMGTTQWSEMGPEEWSDMP
jgi:hypothetical protein